MNHGGAEKGFIMVFTEEMEVRSRFIQWIGLIYFGAFQDIHVRMGAGWTYVYRVHEGIVWANFTTALSKGRYYNAVVKRRFDYVRKYR
jgi:hypothetical protein